jgi:hypothetical protein
MMVMVMTMRRQEKANGKSLVHFPLVANSLRKESLSFTYLRSLVPFFYNEAKFFFFAEHDEVFIYFKQVKGDIIRKIVWLVEKDRISWRKTSPCINSAQSF